MNIDLNVPNLRITDLDKKYDACVYYVNGAQVFEPPHAKILTLALIPVIFGTECSMTHYLFQKERLRYHHLVQLAEQNIETIAETFFDTPLNHELSWKIIIDSTEVFLSGCPHLFLVFTKQVIDYKKYVNRSVWGMHEFGPCHSRELND